MIYSLLYKKIITYPAVNGALFGIRPAVTGLVASAGLYILFSSIFNTKVLSEINSVDIIAVFIAIISFVFIEMEKVKSRFGNFYIRFCRNGCLRN
jgi:chromate transport protein ChrA